MIQYKVRYWLAGGILFSIVFLMIGLAMKLGTLDDWDRSLLIAFYSSADGLQTDNAYSLLDVMQQITALGSHAVILLFVILMSGMLFVAGRKDLIAYLIASVALAIILAMLAKVGFGRLRPDLPDLLDLPDPIEPLDRVHTLSFPSSHAALSMTAYMTLAAIIAAQTRQPRLKTYVMSTAVLVALIVGLSRIYLGVHWPSDVVAGWALGIAVFCFMHVATGRLGFRV